MAKFTVNHVFNCTVDHFWDTIFFDDDFNQSLYIEHLEFEHWELLELNKDDSSGIVKRRIRTSPKQEAPAAIKKVIGDGLTYVESGTYDPSSKNYIFEIELPGKLAKKASIKGRFWLEGRGDDKCERFCEMEIKVKVPLVGKVVEAFIEKQTKDSYEEAAKYTKKFINESML